MLLLCWNCAGWQASLGKIRADYGGLRAWLDLHGADLFLLQEVKAVGPNLANDPGTYGAREEGWDSGAPAARGRARSRRPTHARHHAPPPAAWSLCRSAEMAPERRRPSGAFAPAPSPSPLSSSAKPGAQP